MSRWFSAATCSTLLALSSALAPAQASDKPPKGPWTGSAELGVSATTGNTRNTNINGKFKIAYQHGPWKHAFRLEALQASQSGDTTANRILGEFTSKYALSARDYLFGSARGTHDEFSGYRYQASVAGGYGRNLWISDQGSLSAELGPGYRQAKLDNGETQRNLIARVNGAFEYRFSKSAHFNQDVTVLSGQDNTEIESVTAVTASLTDTLAMKLSYTVQHNSQVPAGTKKTDTFTSVNLVYNFE